MKTPGHTDLLQGKDQDHVEKIIPERLFLFLSLLFEGMAILVCLMENQLKPWCHEGYKDLIYRVSSHKKSTPKHIGEDRAGLFTLIVLLMSCDCSCYVISVFLAVPWFGLQCVIVVFPDHTHLLFCF